ncbi:hypothetical protein [Butyrivibrio sp. MC2021]|uniref:hypothetical protein n=1 Tax=Butyrivibrio sp. MC2021 TaxID=1408306 RepID=UPI00047C31B6|nr:hypothetical protein [Butyrivibrio sp. MC2021]
MDNNFGQNNYGQNNYGQDNYQQYQQYQPNYNMDPQYQAYLQQQQYQQQMMEQVKEKRANRLCTISLILGILGVVILPLIAASTETLFTTSSDAGFFMQEFVATANLLPSFISGSCTIAAVVFMIIARTTAPRNKFAKILMWLYIAAFVLYLILVTLAIAGIFWILKQFIP